MFLAAFSMCIMQHDYHAVASTVYVRSQGQDLHSASLYVYAC